MEAKAVNPDALVEILRFDIYYLWQITPECLFPVFLVHVSSMLEVHEMEVYEFIFAINFICNPSILPEPDCGVIRI